MKRQKGRRGRRGEKGKKSLFPPLLLFPFPEVGGS
jgi:hypothetical protein